MANFCSRGTTPPSTDLADRDLFKYLLKFESARRPSKWHNAIRTQHFVMQHSMVITYLISHGHGQKAWKR